MGKRRIVKRGERVFDIGAILEADDQIWSGTAHMLARCLIKLYDVLDRMGHSPYGAFSYAQEYLQDDIERLASFLFPEEAHFVRTLQERLAREKKPERQRYVKTPIPKELRRAVFERDGFRCRHCGDQFELHADHIYPESKGGATTLDNLQTLCRVCNFRKGKRVTEPVLACNSKPERPLD